MIDLVSQLTQLHHFYLIFNIIVLVIHHFFFQKLVLEKTLALGNSAGNNVITGPRLFWSAKITQVYIVQVVSYIVILTSIETWKFFFALFPRTSKQTVIFITFSFTYWVKCIAVINYIFFDCRLNREYTRSSGVG